MAIAGAVQIELELAVTQGAAWLARAVFRPPALVSIGTDAMAVLCLAAPALPAYRELFRLHLDGGLLLFDPSMNVELKLKEGVQTTDTIISDGLAVSADSGWRLPLVAGSRGAVRYGDVALLFKVRARREAPLKAVPRGEPTLCGSCQAALPWAVVGFAALSPCTGCGTLNEVQVDSGAPEDRRTQMAPVIRKKGADLPTFDAISVRKRATDLPTFDAISVKKGADLPTFDAISVKKGADLPTFDSISLKKGADIPTFDSISVGKNADLPTFDSIAVLAEDANLRISPADQSAPTRRMPPEEQLSGPQPLKPAESEPVRSRRGADLPTFDAISAFKEQGLSTVAAVTALRGDATTDEPPIPATNGEPRPALLLVEDPAPDPGATVKAVTAPMRRPVPRSAGAPPDLVATDSAPPIRVTGGVGVPEVTASEKVAQVPDAPGEKDFFGEEFLVNLEQQRSFVSVPILNQPEMPPRTPPPSNNGVPAGGTLPPHGVGAAPVAREQVHGRPSGFLRDEAPPPRPPLPPLHEDDSGVVSAERPVDEDDDDAGDDFLMGRSDLPSPPSSANRWLLLIGTVAGLSGVLLIAYKLIMG